MRNAKAILLAAAAGLCFLLPAKPTVSRSVDAATASLAECVLEVSSRRFLSARNADTFLPMASTTKVLTAILIIDDCDVGDVVVVPKAAEGVEGSSAYLKAGEEYTVEELLYGLMLRSGNDCAEALALYHSGSIPDFAQAMNEKAAALGAEHSHFVNPHGLPDKRHYTTARDLAIISAYAMENPTFRNIVSCRYYEPRNWANKNKMLREYAGANGVKTGFTLDAGRCLVAAAERDGMQLVCAVLNSPQMYERSTELLDAAYRDYSMVCLCEGGAALDGVFAKETFCYPLTERERELVRVELMKISPLPAVEGEFAGQMKIYLENNLIFSQNLYMMEGKTEKRSSFHEDQ